LLPLSTQELILATCTCLAMQQDQSVEAGGVWNPHRVRQWVYRTHTG